MKISISWLKELVNLKIPIEELIKLLPLRTIGLKEVTPSYFELDMKGYNRADLLSLRGAAYEIAAITDSKIRFSEPRENEYIWMGQNLPGAEVTRSIDSKTFIYCVAKIENLSSKESPQEWINRLQGSGMRSVDNITDVTNLVMLEYGQPLHAFDASKSGGIHVDTAVTGWKFITLDGEERLLEDGDILIRNRTDIIGLGGIMGGKNSEVTASTNTIHLEAAIFNPIQIRKTATRLSLQSEASKRFYHRLTTIRLLQALDAAIRMYQNLGGKLTAISLIDQRELPGESLSNRTFEQMKKIILIPDPIAPINLTLNKINSLIGVAILPQDVEEFLRKLKFKLEKDGGNWQVTPPYFRQDIGIEEDIVEEVARMYGYGKIPSQSLLDDRPTQPENPLFGLLERLKKALFGLGLTEVQTYSFYSTNVLPALGFDEKRKEQLIKVANPISKETQYLRENNWPNLVEVVAKNIRQGFQDIAIFEIGKKYYRNEKEAAEKYSLSIALMNNTENPLAELYELFSRLIKDLNLGIQETEKEEGANLKLFHPNRFIQLALNGKIIGGLAEIHKRVTDKFGIDQRVAILEIDLNKLLI